MTELHETMSERQTAVLVAVDLGDYDPDSSLAELAELAATVEIDAVAQVTQKLQSLDRATCIGEGKLREIAEYVAAEQVDLLIFDHELTATQLRNVEKICDVAVYDRTMLILEIFAARAHSREGRLQVELAQHRYLLPRLSGLGKNLSRLGGGGGGGAGARRGKGETKLELDRRHIRRRISSLEEQLESLTLRRDRQWARRDKDGVVTVAIVGYTNVGKSTLLGALTDAGVLGEDKLFATLDPTARALELPDGRSVMMVDTVGLVRRLPHHLVEAFKSTLEVAAHADLILNVCDVSSPEASLQVEVTAQLLRDLGAADIPVLTALNQCDKVAIPPEAGPATAVISATTGQGLPELLEKIAAMLEPSQRRLNLLIPYDKGALIAEIRQEGKVFSEAFEEGGARLDALVDKKILHRVEEYRI